MKYLDPVRSSHASVKQRKERWQKGVGGGLLAILLAGCSLSKPSGLPSRAALQPAEAGGMESSQAPATYVRPLTPEMKADVELIKKGTTPSIIPDPNPQVPFTPDELRASVVIPPEELSVPLSADPDQAGAEAAAGQSQQGQAQGAVEPPPNCHIVASPAHIYVGDRADFTITGGGSLKDGFYTATGAVTSGKSDFTPKGGPDNYSDVTLASGYVVPGKAGQINFNVTVHDQEGKMTGTCEAAVVVQQPPPPPPAPAASYGGGGGGGGGGHVAMYHMCGVNSLGQTACGSSPDINQAILSAAGQLRCGQLACLPPPFQFACAVIGCGPLSLSYN